MACCAAITASVSCRASSERSDILVGYRSLVVNMLIVNILNIFMPASTGIFRRASASFRPVDLRFRLAPETLQRVGFPSEVLTLLAVGTDGVGSGDLLPFPAAQGRAEQTGPDDDAPAVGGRLAHGEVDAADADRFFAHFDDHFAVVGFIDYRVPRAAPQDVSDVVQTSRPTAWRGGGGHERGQCNTSCQVSVGARA